MGKVNPFFTRSCRLVGEEVMTRISDAKVIIFGVGGVGSWCAESLVRTGIENITIVDCDCVCITNVNRQLMATSTTLGRVKVEVLKERLLDINPQANIVAMKEVYDENTASEFDLSAYDYVIDAIDSLKDKALLIENATRSKSVLFSSMGAALKMDPTKIKVAEFWQVKGCPLARALRQKFKRSKRFPARKFKCVYSDELLENKGTQTSCGTEGCYCKKQKDTVKNNNGGDVDISARKSQINGSLMHITAIFGLTLAGLVIQDLNRP